MCPALPCVNGMRSETGAATCASLLNHDYLRLFCQLPLCSGVSDVHETKYCIYDIYIIRSQAVTGEMSEPQQKKKMSISMIFRRKRLKPQKPSSQDNVEPAIQLQSKENNGSGDMEIVIQNSTNTAFQEAWRQHWKDLSEIEQAEWSSKDLRSPLQAQKTVDDLNQLHREQSIARKIADRTLTFLKAIETLMAGATIGIQAYPEVSSVVVGVIRVVINVCYCFFVSPDPCKGSLANQEQGGSQIF